MLRVGPFGPLSVEVDGRAVPDGAGLRPRSVLAWLLLYPGPRARDTRHELQASLPRPVTAAEQAAGVVRRR